MTVTDTPPTNVSILSSPVSIGFPLVLEGVVDNTNGDALVPNGTVAAEIDLVRLQSDSVFLPAKGKAGPYLAVNGNYRNLTADIAMDRFTYLNQTGSDVTEDSLGNKCHTNSICGFSPPSGFFGGPLSFPTASATNPIPVAISGGTIAASIDLNQSAFVASPSGFLTIDFSQPNSASVVSLPRAGLPTGTLELAEDFIGTVAAVTGNTITIQPSGSRLFGAPLPLIATADGSTRFDNCATATIACIQANQTVSVDGAVKADGSMTLLEVDKLSDTTGDEIEGVIATIDTTNQVFVMAVHNILTATNSTDITFQNQIGLGQPVQVILGSGATFSVDTKGLPVPASNLSTFTGFPNLAPGQMVRVSVSSAGSSTTGTPYIQATASKVQLRFSRLTGNASTVVAGNSVFNYDVTTIPALFGLTTSPQVQIFSGVTLFDGASDLTGVTANDSVSIRALFLPSSTPAFFAAKVRKHLP